MKGSFYGGLVFCMIIIFSFLILAIRERDVMNNPTNVIKGYCLAVYGPPYIPQEERFFDEIVYSCVLPNYHNHTIEKQEVTPKDFDTHCPEVGFWELNKWKRTCYDYTCPEGTKQIGGEQCQS